MLFNGVTKKNGQVSKNRTILKIAHL